MLHDFAMHEALKRERQRALHAAPGPAAVSDLLRRIERALAAREAGRDTTAD